MKAKVISAGGGKHLNVLGVDHFIKVAAQDTNSAYTVMEVVNPPGLGVPMHVHTNEDETFHVVEGTVRFQKGDEVVDGVTGTTVHLPRGVPHRFGVEADKPARMLLVISPSGLEKMFQELSELPPGPPELAKVAAICAKYAIALV